MLARHDGVHAAHACQRWVASSCIQVCGSYSPEPHLTHAACWANYLILHLPQHHGLSHVMAYVQNMLVLLLWQSWSSLQAIGQYVTVSDLLRQMAADIVAKAALTTVCVGAHCWLRSGLDASAVAHVAHLGKWLGA